MRSVFVVSFSSYISSNLLYYFWYTGVKNPLLKSSAVFHFYNLLEVPCKKFLCSLRLFFPNSDLDVMNLARYTNKKIQKKWISLAGLRKSGISFVRASRMGNAFSRTAGRLYSISCLWKWSGNGWLSARYHIPWNLETQIYIWERETILPILFKEGRRTFPLPNTCAASAKSLRICLPSCRGEIRQIIVISTTPT